MILLCEDTKIRKTQWWLTVFVCWEGEQWKIDRYVNYP